jgi:hypothetical protein
VSFDYSPPKTLEQYMLSDALVRCAVGPFGSGKTMASVMELLRRARTQAPYKGVRYSRFAIIRNTLQQLKTTVLEDIKQYLSDIVAYKVTDQTVRLQFALDDGTSVQSDWILMPLDTKEDVKRLLSMQLTGAWVNEVREVPIEVITALIGRVGRYPSKLMGGCTWYGIILDTNPWDVDSPYHDKFVLNPARGWQLFHQPSGIGPHAENVENLPYGYYENLMSGRDTDWSSVHVESEWGTSNAGQAVFRRSFYAPDHVVDLPDVVVNPARPLMVMMDFGRTPSALIGQTDAYDRLIVFQEVVTEDMGLVQMVRERLKPVLNSGPYVNRAVFVVADPSGAFKGQLTDDSPFSVLKDEGFMVYPASTNEIEPRLRAVEKRLLFKAMGQPGLQINRALCPTLVMAMGSKYRYRRKQTGVLDDLPDKSHPWSDVADCLQYGCLAVSSNLAGRVLRRTAPRNAGPAPSYMGWT